MKVPTATVRAIALGICTLTTLVSSFSMHGAGFAPKCLGLSSKHGHRVGGPRAGTGMSSRFLSGIQAQTGDKSSKKPSGGLSGLKEEMLISKPRTSHCWFGIYFDIMAKDKGITVHSFNCGSARYCSHIFRLLGTVLSKILVHVRIFLCWRLIDLTLLLGRNITAQSRIDRWKFVFGLAIKEAV